MSVTSIDADRFDEFGRAVSASGERHSGQVRIAYRLARSHVDQLLHVHGLGWHYWDGTRWAVDDRKWAERAVLDVLRTCLSESLRNDQLRKDVVKCESDAGIKGVLGVASALDEFAATVSDLDANPHVLNCANGTLDLKSRELRPHDPGDKLTKVTGGAYRPELQSSEWEEFLQRILPDEDERAYLQRVFGQSVYGRVREHLFPVLIGAGANGKSTAYGAITNALGDYATIINPELLMARDRGGVGGPETMSLRGARLVIGSETEEGRKLDEAVMKRLTGGDTLTARNLYQPPITWQPSHQLVYVTNALPAVKGNDPAVWRRVRVIPFNVVVPPDERDATLPERLGLQADAILSWVICGHFDYEDNGGMREPGSVVLATGNYQADSDVVARFINDRCFVSPLGTVPSRELFTAWQRWASAEGEQLSEKAFAKELDRLGYESTRTAGRRLRKGLTVLGDDQAEPDDG